MFKYTTYGAKQDLEASNRRWQEGFDKLMEALNWSVLEEDDDLKVYKHEYSKGELKQAKGRFTICTVRGYEDRVSFEVTSDSLDPYRDPVLLMDCMIMEEQAYILQDAIRNSKEGQEATAKAYASKAFAKGVVEGAVSSVALGVILQTGGALLGIVASGPAAPIAAALTFANVARQLVTTAYFAFIKVAGVKIILPKIATELGERNVIKVYTNMSRDDIKSSLKNLGEQSRVVNDIRGKKTTVEGDKSLAVTAFNPKVSLLELKNGALIYTFTPRGVKLNKVFIQVSIDEAVNIATIQCWLKGDLEGSFQEKALSESLIMNEAKGARELNGDTFLILLVRDVTERIGVPRSAMFAYMNLISQNPNVGKMSKPKVDIDTRQLSIISTDPDATEAT